MEPPVLGIDLGTTVSSMGDFQFNQFHNSMFDRMFTRGTRVLEDDAGDRMTQSQVAFIENSRVSGSAADKQANNNAENTIYDIKRLIGRRYSDPAVQNIIRSLPYRVVRGPDDSLKVQVSFQGETRTFFPEEISAMMLSKMRKRAGEIYEKEVRSAVITVPARFNDSQRQATKDAARIAGFTDVRTINEPTAAAIGYALEYENDGQKKTILVFDLGGGTFDVSIMRIHSRTFEVLATDGDTGLGGRDFDNRLAEHFANEFMRMNNGNIRGSAKAMRKLMKACETAKRDLSISTEAQIAIAALHNGIDFCAIISRKTFEELCDGYFQKCITIVDSCLKEAGVSKSEVDEIIMAGGSSQIPKVQSLVSEHFGNKQLLKNINPEEAVVRGAATMAALLSADLNNRPSDVVVHDVTPQSLGIQVEGERMSTIIRRNSRFPRKKKQMYKTAHDNQTSVSIKVFEGELSKTADNNLLGEFTVENLPPFPRGQVVLTVAFEIDDNGILKVSAVHQQTGERGDITITNDKGRLSEIEIAIMTDQEHQLCEEDGC